MGACDFCVVTVNETRNVETTVKFNEQQLCSSSSSSLVANVTFDKDHVCLLVANVTFDKDHVCLFPRRNRKLFGYAVD